MSGEGKAVCVTGASGYIASWLVKMLLESGYTVKATVRKLDDPKKTEHLLALDGAKERLHLFEADLMEEGAFDPVVDGCEGVFHTASPVIRSVSVPKAQLITPAVEGTLNVLRSCAKVPSVKRVVITSSMTSVVFDRKPERRTLNSDVEMDETWFSDPTFCEESKLWYPLSKTLAEEAAWKFVKENEGFDLVTLHPGFVIGPPLQPTLNLTLEGILNLIKNGSEFFADGVYRLVDVRDVAYAHVQAFETRSASGRYCLVGLVTHSSQVLKISHKLYPALPRPQKYEGEKSFIPPYQVSKERAKSLGVDFISLEVTLKDTVESLREKNFLSF